MSVLCWASSWNDEQPVTGLEHLVIEGNGADSVLVAIDAVRGPFRLAYRLAWDAQWRLREADLQVTHAGTPRALRLRADGAGHWSDGTGATRQDLDGCVDIDIWPTPFTNTFPLRRDALAVGERREYRMAWVDAVEMTVKAQPQAYTRLADRLYRFENLDGSGFVADLPVDEDAFVLDYPGLFRRIR